MIKQKFQLWVDNLLVPVTVALNSLHQQNVELGLNAALETLYFKTLVASPPHMYSSSVGIAWSNIDFIIPKQAIQQTHSLYAIIGQLSTHEKANKFSFVPADFLLHIFSCCKSLEALPVLLTPHYWNTHIYSTLTSQD